MGLFGCISGFMAGVIFDFVLFGFIYGGWFLLTGSWLAFSEIPQRIAMAFILFFGAVGLFFVEG